MSIFVLSLCALVKKIRLKSANFKKRVRGHVAVIVIDCCGAYTRDRSLVLPPPDTSA